MSTSNNNCQQSPQCRKDSPEVTNLQNTSTSIVPNSRPFPSPLPTLNSPLEVNNSSSLCRSPCHHQKSSTQSPSVQHPCDNIIFDSQPAMMQMPNLPSITEARMQWSMILSGHHPSLITECFHPFCCVCKLEDGFRATLQQDKNYDDEVATPVQKGVYRMKHMVACTHGSCLLHAHSVCINSDKFIFSLPQFKDLNCF